MLMKMSSTRLCISTALLAIFTYKCFATGGVCNHQCVRNKTCNSEHVHDKCYYLFKDTQRTWNESKHHCKSQNLSVGQIQKGFDTNGLFLGVVRNSLAWQGGTVKDLDQPEYVTGGPFNGTKQDYGSRKCAVINGPQNGKDNSEFDFEDEYCTENHKYICRHDGREIRNYSWGLGQPGRSEDCIAVSFSTNMWRDYRCTSKSSVFALCEKESVCINLPPPNNGKVYTESEHLIKGKTLIGHKAIFTCNEGFILKGSAALTCIGDGPENRFDGQQPTCESTPWILFAISLLIIVVLVPYIIVISKRHRNTHDGMERHDTTDTSLRAMTYVPAAGMAGNTDRSQAMRPATGNDAADNTEIVDNEYYNSSEASGGTTAHGNAENPGFKFGPVTGDIYTEVQRK